MPVVADELPLIEAPLPDSGVHVTVAVRPSPTL